MSLRRLSCWATGSFPAPPEGSFPLPSVELSWSSHQQDFPEGRPANARRFEVKSRTLPGWKSLKMTNITVLSRALLCSPGRKRRNDAYAAMGDAETDGNSMDDDELPLLDDFYCFADEIIVDN